MDREVPITRRRHVKVSKINTPNLFFSHFTSPLATLTGTLDDK